MAHREGRVFREVPLSARDNSHNVLVAEIFPSRDARMASLRIRATQVILRRPSSAATSLPDTLKLNLVDVFEPEPPAGEEPIQWLLLTTEKIDSKDELAAIVDAYRARWTIEEYFKALKTGCAYQARQLESAHALFNTLAVFAPIAWRLLLLRSAARRAPAEPADKLFTTDELVLLRSLSKRVHLSESPTVHDALLAVAGIGGHLKRNGPPGWLTLARGYSTFLTAQLGWLAARQHSPPTRGAL
jgi:IS4 transposase